MNAKTSVPTDVDTAPGAHAGDAGFSAPYLAADFADGADGMAIADIQNMQLARCEARLTEEVVRLVAALREFSSRTQLVREEIPAKAEFCKTVTGFLALLSLQLANALGKGLDEPLFFDDGALYLRKLHLSLNDFVREVDLDGRRFLAVAFVDESAQHGDGSGNA